MKDKNEPVASNSREQSEHAKERSRFKALLLSNPNYFGNLPVSPFEPVLKIAGNTAYEELACLGYHPQQERLEAVIHVHQPSGYGSGICGTGTPEFVRFYLSFDNGASWQDQGLTSFQAFNIPEGTQGRKRLEYAVQLKVSPARKLCIANPLIRARAILSWNNPPPAGQPDWTPVWGNRRDAIILVEPRRRMLPPHWFELAKIETPKFVSELTAHFEPESIAAELQPKALGASELAKLYKGKDVPVHRFAFKELSALSTTNASLDVEAAKVFLPGVGLDLGIGDWLFPSDGNTSYEGLKCIGLDPNSPDTLVGVIQVKKDSGYSGAPCTNGSIEYVAFWADFNGNGTFESHLGTSMVRVYDVAADAREDIFYAVRCPVDLERFRRPCREGPRVVRIRAILSWNATPPSNDPDHVPTWGNREETLINIAPRGLAPAGKIAILGGIPTGHIDDVTGLTTATALFATNNVSPDALGRPCPFAGRVTVQGAAVPGHSYKVEVEPAGGGAPAAVVTNLVLTRQDGTTWVQQANASTGRFDYVDFQLNVNGLLAQWDSYGNDRWVVRLTTYAGNSANTSAPQVDTDSHMLQLDSTAPDAQIHITAGTGDCGKFKIGDVLLGDFVARDTNLRSYSLSVEPAVNPPGTGIPNPASGMTSTPPAPGQAWSLDTAGMKSCGYVVRVAVSDLAIVDSQSLGHHASDSVGFCLES